MNWLVDAVVAGQKLLSPWLKMIALPVDRVEQAALHHGLEEIVEEVDLRC
ncbi:hypothetical protein [Mycobacterium uberis]|nr:hypothetical protein [Mycobacterium uberis]